MSRAANEEARGLAARAFKPDTMGTTHFMTSLISESVGSMAWRNYYIEAVERNNALRSSSTMQPLQLHRAIARMQHDDLPF